MLQDVAMDREPTNSNTTSYAVQVNWGPTEAEGIHDQGRPQILFRAANLRLRTMEKGLGESDLGQDRRAWSALARDVVNAIGDVGSTRPG